VAADERTAAALHIELGSDVAFVRRLRYDDKEPFQLVDSYFHMDAWRQIAAADFDTHPLYDVFKDSFGLYIVHADEFLRADLASKAEAKLLTIPAGHVGDPVGADCLHVRDRPVEYRRSVGRCDRYHYHVRLQ